MGPETRVTGPLVVPLRDERHRNLFRGGMAAPKEIGLSRAHQAEDEI